ncbi:MAG: hypothetical protein J6J17_00320 [Bacilli bacterium]|nr:hypothetical protein [Bacilli bacterium]
MKKSSIHETYYSIGGYREEAMCIEQINDISRIVYHGERGNKYDIRKFNNILDGLVFLIEIFSESDDDYLKK